jgi:hypothetical protein
MISVTTIRPPPDTICLLVLKHNTVRQEIGKLDAGLYNTWLYINGEKKLSKQLFVSPKDVAVLSTGKNTDD